MDQLLNRDPRKLIHSIGGDVWVDGGIAETLNALSAINFSTIASCSGLDADHIPTSAHQRSEPFITISFGDMDDSVKSFLNNLFVFFKGFEDSKRIATIESKSYIDDAGFLCIVYIPLRIILPSIESLKFSLLPKIWN